ncbi:cytidylate kinase-like family protein [Kineococcus glutinatus]|uniref:cytidylate kinase-like family protein n=1 Tax=Kineococcus glutinatus TaxID=1070872 RepID=UPI0031E68677
MPGITISAGYGAGGGVVAPLVAERLGWAFLDRAVTSTVAERLHLPVEEVQAGGGRSQPSRLTRFLASLSAMGAPALPGEDGDAQVRVAMEEEMCAALRGGAVVLGRAGACALQARPDVLRVRLHGPPAARVVQAARLEGVDEATAHRRIDAVDGAREAYVRRLYGCGVDDAGLYHLQLDSTVLPLQACADLVVAAWRASGLGGTTGG